MRHLVLALLLALFTSTASAQIEWISWDPIAIRAGRTEPVLIELQIGGARGTPTGITAVRLDLAAGGAITLTPMGSGRFTGSVPAAQALHDFKPDDVNRNFVGFLRMIDSAGAVTGSYNAFISVLDSTVPPVAVKSRTGAALQTRRILNLHRPAMGLNTQAAVQQFYSYFGDEFDFVQVVFALPNFPGNRHHITVRNDVSGIGLSMMNNTAQYGSAGRLLGVNVYPIDTLFDCGETAFSHETGHQWINFLQHPKLQPGPHWPPSTMAAGVMGFNIPGSSVGGEFNYSVEPAGSGTARVTPKPSDKEFTDFDLYLMGLLPPSQVRDGIVLDGAVCNGCTVPATNLTIHDVIASNGPRLPAAGAAPKAFRVATVVITRDRPLDHDELALLEHFAARGEARLALPFTSGFARGTTKPFFVATRGLASVDLRLTRESSRRRAVAH